MHNTTELEIILKRILNTLNEISRKLDSLDKKDSIRDKGCEFTFSNICPVCNIDMANTTGYVCCNAICPHRSVIT